MSSAGKRSFKWVQPVTYPLFFAVGAGIVACGTIMSRKLLHVRTCCPLWWMHAFCSVPWGCLPLVCFALRLACCLTYCHWPPGCHV